MIGFGVYAAVRAGYYASERMWSVAWVWGVLALLAIPALLMDPVLSP